jgi:tripartite-type tricarboxylate transporter receptor subunit TctC
MKMKTKLKKLPNEWHELTFEDQRKKSLNTRGKMLLLCLHVIFLLASVRFLFPILADAQEFPSKPIRMIVPFAPGGSMEPIVRPLAEIMAKELDKPVVIDNRGGAMTILGTSLVAQAPPDGHTILVATDSAQVLNPLLYKKLPYHPDTDLTEIAMLCEVPVGIMVSSSMPVKTLADLISYAKQNPNRLNFSSSGLGAVTHLAGEMVMQHYGIEMTHVPFKGGGPALIALLTGEVQILFGTITPSLEHVKAGKLRALAVVARQRVKVWPDVPAIVETGADFGASLSSGVVAPGKTPAKIIATLNRAIGKALSNQVFRDRLENLGYIVHQAQEPSYYRQIIERDRKIWAKLIQAKKISLD